MRQFLHFIYLLIALSTFARCSSVREASITTSPISEPAASVALPPDLPLPIAPDTAHLLTETGDSLGTTAPSSDTFFEALGMDASPDTTLAVPGDTILAPADTTAILPA